MLDFSVTPWTIARQAPLSVAFPRQEHWSGLSFPSPGHLLKPGIETAFSGGFFAAEPPRNPEAEGILPISF